MGRRERADFASRITAWASRTGCAGLSCHWGLWEGGGRCEVVNRRGRAQRWPKAMGLCASRARATHCLLALLQTAPCRDVRKTKVSGAARIVVQLHELGRSAAWRAALIAPDCPPTLKRDLWCSGTPGGERMAPVERREGSGHMCEGARARAP